MNAFTTSDYTAYPFASQNRKDFNNLLDVYLDAVFFSRLDPLDFAQEGHRIEFESPHDPTSALVYRGVVYNEMKGDSSSPISTLYEALKKHLYPTTTYHFNSGGDPAHIPDLTYDGLLEFYQSHYHPGNAIFMTFGDIPAVELQQAFEEKVLVHFDRPGEEIAVGPEVRYTSPKRVEEPYGVDTGSDTSGQTHIVLGWLLGKNTDLEMLLKCNLLSDALLDTSASPLRLALESSPLAGGVSPLSGLEETTHEMSFVCGVEGSEKVHADEIEALIIETLERVAKEGIATDKLEACLHQLELNQREIGGDGAPFGLQLMFSCISAAIHRGDPIDLLDLEPVLQKLRKKIMDPGFIKSLVQELLLDNAHRVRLTLHPDAELNQRLRQDEKEKLEALKASLDPGQARLIIEQTDALARRQNAEEDISVLPKVGIEDVSADLDIPEGHTRAVSGGPKLTTYEAGTNGLVYHQIITRIPDLDPDFVVMLPYLTNIIGEIGSGGLGYLATQHLQHSMTGGISAFSSMRGAIDDPDQLIAYMALSSRTLVPKARDLLQILKQTLEAPDFNEASRLRDLVKQSRLRRQGNITGNAHGLAMSAASSFFRPVSLLNHQLSGLEAIARLKKLDDDLSNDEALEAFIE
ncbi:MAG: insulinase family protein, partial [Pseudomonadales bacterium]